VEQRDESFERPRDFDSVEHLTRTLANMPWGVEIEVLFHTSLEEARLRLPGHAGNLEATPDGVILRTQADDMRMAAHYLAGIGWPFTVIRPTELRDEVRVLATTLLEHCQNVSSGEKP
jgi:predicted DNA-binding transcriptional regulator YafY